jgi:hypothetical protein
VNAFDLYCSSIALFASVFILRIPADEGRLATASTSLRGIWDRRAFHERTPWHARRAVSNYLCTSEFCIGTYEESIDVVASTRHSTSTDRGDKLCCGWLQHSWPIPEVQDLYNDLNIWHWAAVDSTPFLNKGPAVSKGHSACSGHGAGCPSA